MAKAKAPRRGGRKKNEWTLVTLAQLLGFIEMKELKQKTFAAYLGVTNSTFHNWKNGRCAPDEEVQGKIKALIDGKEKITVAKKKTAKKAKKTKATRTPRGATSSTLASLTGGGASASAKKKAKKKAKKIAKKVRRGRVGPKAKAAATLNGNGSGMSLDDWNELKLLGQFVRANQGRSVGEMRDVLGLLTTASEIFA